MQITEVEKGTLGFAVTTDKHHLNLLGGVHGGIAATVPDSATNYLRSSTGCSKWMPRQPSRMKRRILA
jgi:acyl-coenzyme A thioesterase PaaI-like protein